MKLDLAGLELKLHKVHFAVIFFEAEAQRGKVYLAVSELTMGKSQ